MAWVKVSRSTYQNPSFPRSSIRKAHDGWIVHSHGSYIGPFKTMKVAKAKGEPWIRQWLRGRG